jgi:hypothetical protein
VGKRRPDLLSFPNELKRLHYNVKNPNGGEVLKRIQEKRLPHLLVAGVSSMWGLSRLIIFTSLVAALAISSLTWSAAGGLTQGQRSRAATRITPPGRKRCPGPNHWSPFPEVIDRLVIGTLFRPICSPGNRSVFCLAATCAGIVSLASAAREKKACDCGFAPPFPYLKGGLAILSGMGCWNGRILNLA